MVSALDRKLLRDLWRLRGQVLTVALVVASGIASYVTLVATYRSLQRSQAAYYERSRFADVFARFERAPESLLEQVALLPGVARAEGRVVEDVLLDLPDLSEPAVGRLVSIPDLDEPELNRLHLREGRLPEPGRALEVLVSEGFATAHGLHPGARVRAVLEGQLALLEVVGVGTSPEYIYAVGPQAFLDDNKRFGIFWIRKQALAAAFRMEGALNDVVLKLEPGARSEEVVAALDRLLASHGGPGAQPRAQQPSHRFVVNELAQLRVQATITPLIFLSVAAFLVNVVLGRLVGTQRAQIATLKAVGYPDLAVAGHYLALVLVMLVPGVLLGVAVGAGLGGALTGVYRDLFHFPVIAFGVGPDVLAVSVGISALSALAGALATAARVARLPPAEAMRPESPPVYHRTLSERLGLSGLISPAARMVVRELERRPLRLLASVLGIALAAATIVLGRFAGDSIDTLMALQFEQMQREDLSLSFRQPVPARALRELEQLPGVRSAEGLRVVPVRLRAGSRTYETQVQGSEAHGSLRRVLDARQRSVPVPAEGLLLGRELGRRLALRPGDTVQVEVLEGERQQLQVPVAGLVEELVGLSAYMDRRALSRLLGEEPRLSGAALVTDPAQVEALYRRLKELPAVLGVARKSFAKQYFQDQQAQIMLVVTFVLSTFSALLAVGIVYNNARITLAVRARDLASLRVLGFTRREISSVLLGELAVSVLLALPVGLWLGRRSAGWIMDAMADAELFQLPAVIYPDTYAFAALVVLGAALFSALLVRRRLDHLDLIGVLKTRE